MAFHAKLQDVKWSLTKNHTFPMNWTKTQNLINTFGNNGPNVYKTSLAAKFEQNQSILMYSVICPNQHRGIIAKV